MAPHASTALDAEFGGEFTRSESVTLTIVAPSSSTDSTARVASNTRVPDSTTGFPSGPGGPVISTLWSRRTRIVSPAPGRTCSRTLPACARACSAGTIKHAITPDRREYQRLAFGKRLPVRIVDRCSPKRGSLGRRLFAAHDAAELRLEIRLDVLRSSLHRRVARPQDLVLFVERDDVLDKAQLDRRIERAQGSQHRLGQRRLLGLREAVSTLATGEYRRPRESHEDWLREVRMPDHQLPLVERGELGASRRSKNLIPRRCQFVRVHAAEQRGRSIPHNAPVHLRPELLGAKKHQPQVPSALRNIQQHPADVRVRPV